MITLSKKHKKRLLIIILLVLGISTTVALAISAFRENMLYYFSPTQIVAGEVPIGSNTIRVGGMVAANTVKRVSDSLRVQFNVTDYANTVTIYYEGILPDLFREGQGVVAIGKMQKDGSFLASEVLAKHDENYMPPEVAASLKTAKVK